ncbi:MAG: phage protein Gp27 family protein [Phenylobacterium sp.]|uniref:phage protein Gp27 family protein n=1 Tax=Phenylobacterium sp. TaxID=1871053 RepID=UPI003918F40E
MAPRSTVERLPEGARKALEEWLVEFNAGQISLDEVMSRLEALLDFNDLKAKAPSRSAVHRHAQKFQAIGERIKRSEHFAAALAKEVGPHVADGQGFQVLIQAFQSLAFEMIGNLEEDQALDPENLMFFARSLQSVASAQKTDADRVMKIQQEARKTAAAQAEKVMKSRGMSADTIDVIRKAVLGTADG